MSLYSMGSEILPSAGSPELGMIRKARDVGLYGTLYAAGHICDSMRPGRTNVADVGVPRVT